jgi:MoxR-like ATPase
MGFIHATGECVRTPLREAFEHGGVFLLDECDAGSPAVMVTLNSLVGNRWASFPDGMVEAHPDFRLIAGANCFGTGADRQYVGRQQQDAAMLDRFAFVELGYDQRIIRSAMGLPPGDGEAASYQVADRPHGKALNAILERWHRRVLDVAKRVEQQQVRAIVGARAAILGAALLRNGVAWDSVERMLLWKGMADDVRNRLA